MKTDVPSNRIAPQVAIYVRLSDEDKNKNKLENSESIKNQIALASKYVQEKNWCIYDIYIDDDWSGLDKNRPEFKRLLKDCEEQKINIVVCKDMSRFTRDKIITEEYLETKFFEWGIRFIGLSDGTDTADNANKKSREINALVNQWYAEDISNKVKYALKIKRETGNFIGSFAPYGYKKSAKNKNKLEIDPIAATVVKKIFHLYLNGNGTSAIANILNKEKTPNPCTYKELTLENYKNPFKKKQFSVWNKTSVKRILRNEVYLGRLQQNKIAKIYFKTKKRKHLPKYLWTTVCNTHSPIIDEDTFAIVQKQMDAKIRSSGHGKVHLFAGKIICKDCKSPLIKTSSGKYSYLSCSLYKSSPANCTRHSIRLDRLTQIVEKQLKQYLNNPSLNKDTLIKTILQMHNPTAKENDEIIIAHIQQQINDLNKAIKQAYLDRCKENIKEEIWRDLLHQFQLEKDMLNQELTRLNKKQAANRFSYTWGNLENIVNNILQFKNMQCLLINALIKRIEVGENINYAQELIIYYTFQNPLANSLPT